MSVNLIIAAQSIFYPLPQSFGGEGEYAPIKCALRGGR